MKIEVELPESITLGDLTTVAGALTKAAAEFVDWEALHDEAQGHHRDPAPISTPGVVLLDMARQMTR